MRELRERLQEMWGGIRMDLFLRLKREWFDKIKSGEKTEEYRETTSYWRKRIEGRTFDRIVLVKGRYGDENTPGNKLIFPWNGYVIKQIGSWEKQEMIEVFAIPLIRDDNS
jgi:hypothetical protein